ncbi:hypothetical protein F7725_005274 [Dissostichus mawsoni]|uniref:Uncharacterized protein n=1 Tax=Dissostichus mawsoni TaxID=36200 RepID=A0A7J5YT98_DISMA|nr:hypothetical protein F7725_005274 [Dissostichus mawsoni]
MMDPFQQKYGNVMSSLLILPALVADVLWVARTLVSLVSCALSTKHRQGIVNAGKQSGKGQ